MYIFLETVRQANKSADKMEMCPRNLILLFLLIIIKTKKSGAAMLNLGNAFYLIHL